MEAGQEMKKRAVPDGMRRAVNTRKERMMVKGKNMACKRKKKKKKKKKNMWKVKTTTTTMTVTLRQL
jgi:hypothetical protein